MVDYTEFRKMIVELHQLANVNDKYYFYYDETNNCRKFLMREEQFNVSSKEDFILGGVVTKEPINPTEIEELIVKMKFQPNMKEFKLKHLCGNGNFLECLKSDKLFLLLNWLDAKDINIHFANINLLYYAVVDLIDAYAMDIPDFNFITNLKSTVYKYVDQDIDNIHNLLYSYQYPNIKPEQFEEFSDLLINWINNLKVADNIDRFYMDTYKQMINANKNSEANILLQNNHDHLLIEEFSSLYILRLVLFNNAKHILDEEVSIQENITKQQVMLDGKELDNYHFVKSESDRMIQLADVICGLIGKMFVMANTINEQDLELIDLNEMQVTNLTLLKKIIDKSILENQAFIQNNPNMLQINRISQILDLPNQSVNNSKKNR